jgi:hypothetical protein
MFFKLLGQLASSDTSKEISYLSYRLFLDCTFDYSRLRHFENRLTFSAEQSQQLRNQLPTVIQRLTDEFLYESFRSEEIYEILIYRSVIQFLRDDFADDYMNDESRRLVQCWFDTEVFESEIEQWSYSHGIGPWPESNVPDLQGVPDSHRWWTQAHRRGEHNEIRI